MMNTPTSNGRVSIIMPSYNSAEFIGQAIESVIQQEYSNWKLIIVDDCSIDDTLAIVQRYAAQDSRIIWRQLEQNGGAAVARNTAIQIADGEFIAFLDSDDLWDKRKLNVQIEAMNRDNYHFSCTSYGKIDENGKASGRIVKALPKSDYEGLLKHCPGNSTVVYRAKAIGKFYIPPIRKRNDYVMWLQILKTTPYIYGVQEVLSSHRERIGSISSKKSDLVKYHWHIYRRIEKLSVFKSAWLVVYWISKKIFIALKGVKE